MIRCLVAATSLFVAAPAAAAAGRLERVRLLGARRVAAAEGASPIISLPADGAASTEGQLDSFGGTPGGAKALAAGGQGNQASKKKETQGKQKAQKFQKKWLSFWYWKPLVASIGFLMLFVDIGGPLVDRYYDFSLQTEVALCAASMYGFALTVIFLANKQAAGMTNLLAVATIGCTLTLLMVVLTVSMTVRRTKGNAPMMLLATDVAGLMRPALHLIVVCLILDVVATEASVDWGQLAMLFGFFMLGIALSLSGVIGDIMAHVFLRMDNHFVEGDFIVYAGGLVQIAEMKWRHTVGITEVSNAVIFIPNSELTAAPIVNQSQDSDRSVEVDILVNMDAEKLNQAVKNAWDLLATTDEEDFTFTGLDGRVYTNQFNTADCGIWVKETCDAVHIKFTGEHYFSNPPPFEGEGEEPPWIDRQQEWEQGWQMQVEWFNIQLKKTNEELGAWPYIPDDFRVP